MRNPRRIGFKIALVASGFGLLTAFAQPAAAATGSFSAPVYSSDFPDPSVVLVNGTYWAYATGSAGRNLQVMSSANMANWSPPADPLPVLPTWASSGLTWAPGVIRRGSTFVMYYTVHDPALGRQCVSVATSSTPAGPFADTSSGPLVCQTADGGSIDPNPYVDPATGNTYLIWKSDDNALGAGHATHMWGEQLSTSGLAFAAGTKSALLLTESAAWQAPSAEGPTVIRHGSRYYLFYGANNYDTASSGIGYATSSSLLGSYANQSLSGPWLGTRGNAQGPQGPCVFVDAAGTTRMAFAAWYGTVGYEHGGVRSLWIGSLSFGLFGTPSIS